MRRYTLGGEAGAAAMGLAPADVEKLTDRFQAGVRDAVELTAKLKGLFDSLGKALYETLRVLFEDMDDMRAEEAAAKVGRCRLTQTNTNHILHSLG
jgi:hypothetical protein